MLPIQIMLVVFLVVSLALAFLVLKQRLFGRLFFAAQFIVGAIFVIVPDLSTKAASFLGIGRGTDLLLYFLIVLFYATVLFFIAKLRRMERDGTAIVRALSIHSAIDNTGHSSQTTTNKD